MSARDDPTAAELAELLARISRGDRDALATLYQLTRRVLYGVCLRLLRRPDLAEEVLHDAYLRIWNAASRYRPGGGSPMGWMLTLTRHMALDRLRRGGRETPIEQIDPEPDALDRLVEPSQPVAEWIVGSGGPRLRACLEQLELEQRSCILLAFVDGFSHDELAQRTGRPLGTVKSWIRRGLLQLRECLGA